MLKDSSFPKAHVLVEMPLRCRWLVVIVARPNNFLRCAAQWRRLNSAAMQSLHVTTCHYHYHSGILTRQTWISVPLLDNLHWKQIIDDDSSERLKLRKSPVKSSKQAFRMSLVVRDFHPKFKLKTLQSEGSRGFFLQK